ncbi:hypothetical protein [Streptomyces sp. TM32]|uniref:hypothetical protein n=1 Tax=Streptomyces sp. TM32 TaxID=1652669 RepID=UPI0012AB83B4|nr:hypothetical protein [Streptomyces sp. TM32]
MSASSTVHAMAGYHFYRAYWTLDACLDEGHSLGYSYKCQYGTGNDGKKKWFLYLWY